MEASFFRRYQRHGFAFRRLASILLLALSPCAIAATEFSIPKRSEIKIIANKPQGRTAIFFECHVPVKHEQILSFFSGASKIYEPDVDIFDYSSRGYLTPPKKLPLQLRKELDKLSAQAKDVNLGAIVHVEGALITKDEKIYFWRLYSDHVLLLWRDDKTKRVVIKE